MRILSHSLVLGLGLCCAAQAALAAEADLMILNKSKAPWTLGIASKKQGMAGKIIVKNLDQVLATLDAYGDTYVIKPGEMIDAIFQPDGGTACNRNFSFTDNKRGSVTLNGKGSGSNVSAAPTMATWGNVEQTLAYSPTAGIVIKTDTLVLSK